MSVRNCLKAALLFFLDQSKYERQPSGVLLLEHAQRGHVAMATERRLYNSASRHAGRWLSEDCIMDDRWHKKTFA